MGREFDFGEAYRNLRESIKEYNQDLYGMQGKHLVPKWLKDLLTYLKLKELQRPRRIKAKYSRRIVLNELNRELACIRTLSLVTCVDLDFFLTFWSNSSSINNFSIG